MEVKQSDTDVVSEPVLVRCGKELTRADADIWELEVEVSIRALWLLDRSNKCVFRWIQPTLRGNSWFAQVEKEFTLPLVSDAIRVFVRGVALGRDRQHCLELDERSLIVYIHDWFTIVADASLGNDFLRIMPAFLKSIDDTMRNDPLSFSELLSNDDMPGVRKLLPQLVRILDGQETKLAAAE